jgi:hypothetical protein
VSSEKPIELEARKIVMLGCLPTEMAFTESSESLASLVGELLGRALAKPGIYHREASQAAAPDSKPFPDHECGLVEWMPAERGDYGPEKTGWAMCVGSTDYGAANVYVNVRFCPLCGKELPV